MSDHCDAQSAQHRMSGASFLGGNQTSIRYWQRASVVSYNNGGETFWTLGYAVKTHSSESTNISRSDQTDHLVNLTDWKLPFAYMNNSVVPRTGVAYSEERFPWVRSGIKSTVTGTESLFRRGERETHSEKIVLIIVYVFRLGEFKQVGRKAKSCGGLGSHLFFKRHAQFEDSRVELVVDLLVQPFYFGTSTYSISPSPHWIDLPQEGKHHHQTVSQGSTV